MATSAQPSQAPLETKKKSGKLLTLAGILLLVGANAGFWFYYAKLRPAAVLRSAAQTPESGVALENVTLDPFIVNLAGGGGYLKVAMTLSIRKGARSQEKPGEPGTDLAHSALVRDTILDALSSQDAGTLLTAEGKAALKKTLKMALDAKTPGLQLDRIYFTDFLVQP